MQIGNLPARQADQKHMHDAAELIGRGGGENKYFCLWSVKAPPPFMPFISFLKHFGTINILPLHCVGFVGGGGGGVKSHATQILVHVGLHSNVCKLFYCCC